MPVANESNAPLWRRPGFYLGCILLVYLIVGIRAVTEYGETWDEPPRIEYAYRSLAAYRGEMTDLSDEKGPLFGMLQVLGAGVLQAIIPVWQFIHAWHFMIFLSYLLGTFFFYRLSRRLIEGWPALAAALLFSTQPLIWGHAFMNPKDLPFTVFFIGSVTLGLEMVDHFFPRKVETIPPLLVRIQTIGAEILEDIRCDWAASPVRLRKGFVLISIPLLILVGTYPWMTALIRWLAFQIYSAPPDSVLGGIFIQFIQRPVEQPVDWYADRLLELYRNLTTLVGVGLALSFGGIAFVLFPTFSGGDPAFLSKPVPWIYHKLRNLWAEVIAALRPSTSSKWLERSAHYVLDPRLILAGCFLGFVNDIRSLGPASGVLVAVYLLAKGRKKAIPVLLAYLGISALVTYLCWPYLWHSPITNYLKSASEAADFEWNDTVLFGGLIYRGKKLPFSFIPTLFCIQYTETALLMVVIGVMLALIYFHRHPSLRMDMLLLGVWFAAPVVAAILHHSIVYDNARQFLFVIPPLFVLAGIALQAMWNWLKHRLLWFIPLALLLIAPAVYWNIRLHPYEYIYYNSLVGGVQGAFRNYENDYWALSYKEGMDYINQTAPRNARVYVYGPLLSCVDIARPDLQLTDELNGYLDFSYALIMTKRNIDQRAFPDSTVVFQVTRDNAVLSLVKQIQPGEAHGFDKQVTSPRR